MPEGRLGTGVSQAGAATECTAHARHSAQGSAFTIPEPPKALLAHYHHTHVHTHSLHRWFQHQSCTTGEGSRLPEQSPGFHSYLALALYVTSSFLAEGASNTLRGSNIHKPIGPPAPPSLLHYGRTSTLTTKTICYHVPGSIRRCWAPTIPRPAVSIRLGPPSPSSA